MSFEAGSSKGSDDGFFAEMSRDCVDLSTSVPSNFMGLIAAPIMSKRNEATEEDKENCVPAIPVSLAAFHLKIR